MSAHYVFGTHDDAPVVCVEHGRFIPCRKRGEHFYTDLPYWVARVRDYHADAADGPCWTVL